METMHIRKMRRAAFVTGLALCATLAFGGLAQASTAPAAETGGAVTQEADGHLFVKGKVTGLKTAVINGHKVLVMEMSGGKHTVNWGVTKRTAVTEHGRPVPPRAIEVGDLVTAQGRVPGPGLPPEGAIIAASAVAIH